MQFSDAHAVQLSRPVPCWAFAEHWLAPQACRQLTLQQRRELMCHVAASGDVVNLRVAIQAAECTPSEQVLEAAAGAGALDCCEHIVKSWKPSSRGWGMALDAAAKGGHRSACEWSLAQRAEPTWWAVGEAYRGGHPELVDLLKSDWPPSPDEMGHVLAAAAEGCSLQALKAVWAEWGELLIEESPEDFGKVLSAAVGSPTAEWEDKAEFLMAINGLGPDGNRLSIINALRLPPDTALRRLEWMRLRGFEPGEYWLYEAFEARSTAAMTWILDFGGSCSWNRNPVVDSMRDGAPLELVQLLVTRGLIAPAQVAHGVLWAGAQGLPVLRWLVEAFGPGVLDPTAAGEHERCPRWSFSSAASGGCPDAMAIVHEYGAPYGLAFDESTWGDAAGSGCEAALEWLAEKGCPMPAYGGPYVIAAGNGDARTLHVLRRLGLPWDALVSAGREKGHYQSTLRFMAAQGLPMDWAEAVTTEAAAMRAR